VGVVKIATSKGDIKRLDLRFQPLSQEIAICHSLHGGQFGEQIDPVKDAKHRFRRRKP
jgi:hypothetical protein